MSCKKCSIVLDSNNWYSYFQAHKRYICKKCFIKSQKKYTKKTWSNERKIKRQKWEKQYYLDNKDKIENYYKDNRSTIAQTHHLYNVTLKIEVLSHYSGANPPQCANPYKEHKEPYQTIWSLSLDKIAGDHFKSKLPTGVTLYGKLKKEGYPEGWQVLCMNCQMIKRHENNENPHLR
jgi:hypothetical protein